MRGGVQGKPCVLGGYLRTRGLQNGFLRGWSCSDKNGFGHRSGPERPGMRASGCSRLPHGWNLSPSPFLTASLGYHRDQKGLPRWQEAGPLWGRKEPGPPGRGPGFCCSQPCPSASVWLRQAVPEAPGIRWGQFHPSRNSPRRSCHLEASPPFPLPLAAGSWLPSPQRLTNQAPASTRALLALSAMGVTPVYQKRRWANGRRGPDFLRSGLSSSNEKLRGPAPQFLPLQNKDTKSKSFLGLWENEMS